MPPARRPDVLALGGGGVLGEAWLRSCLAGLEAGTGWDLRECDAFVGTSAGSIVAAVIAAGRRPGTARRVAEDWERSASAGDARSGAPAGGGLPAVGRGLQRAALAAAAPLAPVAGAGLAPAGAVVRAAVLRRGRRGTRDLGELRGRLADLDATFDGRLRVTAVDLASGKRVVFGAPGAPEAEVPDAVLASCAVPWVFRPVEIGGREYVDGGAWSAANLDVAPVAKGGEVLCLNPTASPRLAADRVGAIRAFAVTTAAAESLVLRRRGAHVRIVAPDDAAVEAIGPDLFDARRRPAVEVAGYAQGRALASPA